MVKLHMLKYECEKYQSQKSRCMLFIFNEVN